MKFIFARHCKATGQEREAELTKEGLQQADELSRYLEKYPVHVTRILSSPFTRAKQSIRSFSESKGIEIEVDEPLGERSLSSKPLDDWLEILENSFTVLDQKVRDGESSKEAMERAASLLHELMDSDEDDETVLLMTHGNLLALILKYFDDAYGFEEWKSLTNPDLFLAVREGKEWAVKRMYEE
ncbi:histidine phosphatase family protein [Pontibacillus sp. HMF3514]|uniref:histidine phosphatase family protein n=1 Tax=Pontibacillus sp. HMF3514 TaxID=2692425 RepID=UPI00131F4A44|nr:histidine phosphatase family protein [Pontibacillus sp. HMF3514]QHE52429.1 histidine phosphatase family protein [Pontibacillus sp. HMF3514]